MSGLNLSNKINKTILVIDDDEDILCVLDILLQLAGFQPYLSRTGLPIEEVAAINPALIMTDVRISGYEKTGAELCKELKEHSETLSFPVILISAEYELPKLAADSMADAYIAKPFDIDYVLSTVNRYF
ncbi:MULTISPECIES: response regulator [unclassified Pedobacter]|uniref:response regulator n=1 Tax=unclassified Pedobacter TaxID=2628915 RepID=UPI001E337BE4|nr:MULTISPECIES: response regulator [unclassified Pedobacter]